MGNWLGFPDEDPQPGDTGNPTRQVRPAIESMAVHVKDVLPQVPMDVIRKDLTVTTNVDETITRLLDGTVTYIPEKKPPSSATTSQTSSVRPASTTVSPSPSFSAPTQPPLITAASSFGKSADERHKSFEERKKNLIEEAKRRYLAKQALMNQASGSS